MANTSTFNSLPRRSNLTFQRNTPARRSAGPLESHIEYFVPRSVSEFNLAGVGDIALPMQMPQQQRRSPPPSILSHTRSTGTIMIPIQEMQHQHHQQQHQQQQQQQMHAMSSAQSALPPIKPREKMVTFEDETKCPHGVPTTPRKTMPMTGVNDVFM
ncbi:uncharacterized protein LOC129566491 [Sitodiplosis mosellana]|uniref:uncharacterized protein LOC129566491 n=1 Tax=Sitodiplosis mosellana TaxID=263140 RepID=UPI002443A9C7|nr:uncharacterized protein LOC129566491 [Sitodiplosis mosellana]